MWDTIAAYWMQWACGLLAAAMAALWRWAAKRLAAQRKDSEALKAGVKAVLHDRLWQAHKQYMAQGWCSLEDKKNVEYLPALRRPGRQRHRQGRLPGYF